MQLKKKKKSYQELSKLEESHPHIPGSQVRGMWRAAEEKMGHCVVIGAGGVIGPAYGVAVRLEPWTVAEPELRNGALVKAEQRLFGWVY